MDKTIDTITFDLWNTLVCNTPRDGQRYKDFRLKGIEEALSEANIRINLNDLEEAHDRTFEECKKFWDKNIDIDSNTQIDILLGMLTELNPKNLDQETLKKIKKAYIEPVLYNHPDLVENAQEVLSGLKGKDYKIGLICNTGRTPGNVARKLLGEFGILEYFDGLSFSNELRVRKPHKKIFLYTLNQLESLPRTSVHVGDELKTDVLGAKNVGMNTVHLKRKDQHYQDIVPDRTIFDLKELFEILLT